MTPSLAAGVLTFCMGLVALVFISHGLVVLARDWAEDRRREAEYAQQFQDARFARHLRERQAQRERDLHDHAHYEGKPE